MPLLISCLFLFLAVLCFQHIHFVQETVQEGAFRQFTFHVQVLLGIVLVDWLHRQYLILIGSPYCIGAVFLLKETAVVEQLIQVKCAIQCGGLQTEVFPFVLPNRFPDGYFRDSLNIFFNVFCDQQHRLLPVCSAVSCPKRQIETLRQQHRIVAVAEPLSENHHTSPLLSTCFSKHPSPRW